MDWGSVMYTYKCRMPPSWRHLTLEQIKRSKLFYWGGCFFVQLMIKMLLNSFTFVNSEYKMCVLRDAPRSLQQWRHSLVFRNKM